MKLGGKSIPGKDDIGGKSGHPEVPAFVKVDDSGPDLEGSPGSVEVTIQALAEATDAVLTGASAIVPAASEPAEPVAEPVVEPAAEPVAEPVPAAPEPAVAEPVPAAPEPALPPITSMQRAKIGDFESLPGNVVELRDPFRSAVLVQLRTFLARIRLFKRSIDEVEKEALGAILERLQLLRASCADAGQSDWVNTIDSYIADLNEILGNTPSVSQEGPEVVAEGTLSKILRALGMKKS